MGKLVIISGPSGAGKSTIVKSLLENENYGFVFSVSATSRAMRDGEIEGENYHFLSIDEFKSKIEEKRFLEWEEVYPSQYYGTLKTDVDVRLAEEKNVLFDVDVMGAINIKREYKDICKTIFIMPPSVEELEARLRGRNTEDEASIKKRVRKSKMEMHYSKKFDNIVENVELDKAVADVNELVKEFMEG